MSAEGSFSTTLDVVGSGTFTVRGGQGAPAPATRQVDCAVTACAVISWSAHSAAVAPSFATTTPIGFGPSIRVTPQTDLPATGANVTVTGAGFDPADNANGVYVAQSAVVDGTRLFGAAQQWVSPSGAGGPVLNDDGTFTTTLAPVAVGPFVSAPGAPATTVDCRTTACTVYTWAAHADAVPAWRTSQPLTFLAGGVDPGTDPGTPSAGTPSLSASPVSGLSITDPTTVTVTGSGYDPTARQGEGVYVAFGPLGATAQTAFQTSKWIHPGATPSAGQDVMTATGTFATTLTISPTFGATNCTVIACAIQTFSAHGNADRSQDKAIAVSFAGTAASTPEAPTTTSLVPDAAPTSAPSTTGSAASGTPLVGPKVTKVAVGKRGKVALSVSAPSSVTFTVRRKVGRKYVVVKTVTVSVKRAGAVTANLKITKQGLYRISMQAKGADGGTKTVVKSLRVR
jgi:hypothetical protein